MIYKLKCQDCERVIHVETDREDLTDVWCMDHSGIRGKAAAIRYWQDPEGIEQLALGVAKPVQLDLLGGQP